MNSPALLVETASKWLDCALASVDGAVVLTSPYISYGVCKRVMDAAQASEHSFTLVTTLDPAAVANGYLSVKGLSLAIRTGVKVLHVARLHAKAFVVGTRAMLGSANLTGSGLGSWPKSNRELGIEVDQATALEMQATIAQWPARNVTESDLNDLSAAAKGLTAAPRFQSKQLDAASALHLAEKLLADAREPQRGLWLKLEYGQPSLDGWRQESWFASPKKGKPGFRPGDLVFICAQDTSDCYAIVEVISEPEFQPLDYGKWTATEDPEALERWPWINRTKPRLVPSDLMGLTSDEFGIKRQGLQNGHVRLKFDEFTFGVRSLAQLASI